MKFQWKLTALFTILNLKLYNVNGDPCSSYKPIPDIHRREVNFELSEGEASINDREIFEDWYGNINFKLPDNQPGYFKCGGWYPMWRKQQTALKATICVQTRDDPCAETFDIETKSCNGFDVYYLQKAPVHRASYCFDNNADAPPDFNVKPWISVDLDHQEDVSKLLFRCYFPPSVEDLFYKTIWFVEGAPVYTFEPAQWSDYIIDTTLTEDMLAENNVTKAGINIQCAVRAQRTISGGSSGGELSENKFVGVKIHHWRNSRMTEGETRQLDLSISVPFGCGTEFTKKRQPCDFNVEVVTVENPTDCSSAAVLENSCGIKPFTAEKWEEKSSLSVVGKITSTYGEKSGLSILKLKTPEKVPELSSFWRDYEIGSISIQITKNTSLVKEKDCSLVNDPYLSTFDSEKKRAYEFQLGGVYWLYEDKDRGIEVQVQTEICTSKESWGGLSPYCTCGVAVRAGRTVFEIGKCESLTWNIGFSACEDGGDVMSVTRSDKSYKISLYTGTTMDVEISNIPWFVAFLNVKLYPTVLDEGKSRGMCGVLSSTEDDDLTMRNGLIANSFEEFVNSWKVPDTESLFDPFVIERGFLSHKRLHQYCICNETNEDKTITCSPMAAIVVSKQLKNFEKIKPRSCFISKRKKRMAIYNRKRVKRQAPVEDTWTNGWNETAATNFCESKFAESPSVQKVKNVPGVDISSPMMNCIADIKASGTTYFTNAAVAGVAVRAIREAMVNPVLSEPDPANPSAPTLFDVITLQTCPSDCSGRGVCKEGECQCNDGYGAKDCSVVLATAPEMFHIDDEDYCDLASRDCLIVAVFGNTFSGDEGAKCRIKTSMFEHSGVIRQRHDVLSQAIFISISEVDCTLPKVAIDDVVVSHAISVSNNGQNYSNELNHLVYDSSCVTVNQATNTWSLEEGYCTYEGRCSAKGDLRPDDPCLQCDGRARWKRLINSGCPGATNNMNVDTSNNLPTIIGASIGVGLLLIITIVAVVVMCRKRRIYSVTKHNGSYGRASGQTTEKNHGLEKPNNADKDYDVLDPSSMGNDYDVISETRYQRN